MIALAAAALTGVAITIYLVIGSAIDWHKSRRQSQRDEAMRVLTESAFLDHDSAAEALRELRGVPSKVIWNLALTVPLHFDDHLSRRILHVIGGTGARRRIERLAKSRFWFRRVQAARLAHVLPANERAAVDRLLIDPSATVQSATIESFGTDQVAQHARAILEHLGHSNQSVRFTAQQALLRSDGRITEPLREWLASAGGKQAQFGLEVAANLNDPRLVHAISSFAGSPDPTIRRLVARATPDGIEQAELGFFETLLNDSDPLVRATAIDSSVKIDADWLLPRVAEALTDSSWRVRRTAGRALADSGALGDLFLRAALDSPDPFAADTARQFLEMRGRMEQLDMADQFFDGSAQELDSLTAWAHR